MILPLAGLDSRGPSRLRPSPLDDRPTGATRQKVNKQIDVNHQLIIRINYWDIKLSYVYEKVVDIFAQLVIIDECCTLNPLD
jgi:hypothetical protein